jgi:hypothetical protein
MTSAHAHQCYNSISLIQDTSAYHVTKSRILSLSIPAARTTCDPTLRRFADPHLPCKQQLRDPPCPRIQPSLQTTFPGVGFCPMTIPANRSTYNHLQPALSIRTQSRPGINFWAHTPSPNRAMSPRLLQIAFPLRKVRLKKLSFVWTRKVTCIRFMQTVTDTEQQPRFPAAIIVFPMIACTPLQRPTGMLTQGSEAMH